MRTAGLAGSIVVAGTLVCCLVALASAGTVKARHGVYDCYQSDLSGMHYVNSVRLAPHGRYVYADDRHGQHLVPPTLKGKYRLKGRTIIWRTGVFHKQHLKAKAETSSATKPHLYLRMISTKTGEPTGVNCYLVKKS